MSHIGGGGHVELQHTLKKIIIKLYSVSFPVSLPNVISCLVKTQFVYPPKAKTSLNHPNLDLLGLHAWIKFQTSSPKWW